MKRLPVPYEEFEAKFLQSETPVVRLYMDHALFRTKAQEGTLKVTMRSGISPEKLISKFSLYAPWHVSLDTNKPVMPNVDTRPILLNAIIHEQENIREWHVEHISSIRDWFSSLGSSEDIVNIDIVTLYLGGKRLLIMDGNHRLSALVHEIQAGNSSPHVRITEYRIKSKHLSAKLLPDLIALT